MSWFKRETLADYQRPFWLLKEWRFQRWFRREVPRRPELEEIPIALSRLLFERRDRSPDVGGASVLLINELQGRRFLAAIDNMLEGRALEYRNVRFRLQAGGVIEGAVQTTERPHRLAEAQDAFEHAEDVLGELRANHDFANATKDLLFEFSLVYEQPEKSDRRDITYYRKANGSIIRSD